jgi:hypothetical protein
MTNQYSAKAQERNFINFINDKLSQISVEVDCIKISKVNSQNKDAILEVLEVDESGHIHSMMGLARVQRS